MNYYIRCLFTLVKKRIQVLLGIGQYGRRMKVFRRYVKKILSAHNKGTLDVALLKEFMLFSKKNHLLNEEIAFLEGLRQRTRNKEGIDFILLQSYIVQNRRFIIKKKARNSAFIKKKAVSVIHNTLRESFGPDYLNTLNSCLTPDPARVKASIVIMNEGWENLGFIEHMVAGENKCYLTKIGISQQANNEIKFYQSLTDIFPALKQVTPAIPVIRTSENSPISLLMMEKAAGDIAGTDQFADLVDLHLTYIQPCGYKRIDTLLAPEQFELGYHHQYLYKSFCHIHEQEAMLHLVHWIDEALEQARYAPVVKQAIRGLGRKIREVSLYAHVDPEKHYALCHGDFSLNNVLYDRTKGQYTIIDWTQCVCGPRLLDVAILLRKQKRASCGYKQLDKLVLQKIKHLSGYDETDQVLFLYATLVLSILLKRKMIIQEDPEYFFLPATKKCHELLDRLPSKSYAATSYKKVSYQAK